MRRLANVLFLLSLLASLPAWAEKADKNKPVNVEADRVHVDDKQKTAVYEGHVVMSQGTLMITAERIEVRQDDQGFASGLAVGKQVYFRERLDNSEELAEGWADTLEYDARGEKVKLTGKAHFKHGLDDLRGNVITYDKKTDLFQAQGSGGQSGRVHAVIRPKNASTPGRTSAPSPDGKP